MDFERVENADWYYNISVFTSQKSDIQDYGLWSETAMIASKDKLVVNGLSTLKVSKFVETICVTSISKSAISDLCKGLDKEADKFRIRPLTRNYPFLTVNATYFMVRENHRI